MAIRDATPIVLTADERSTLEGWVRSGAVEHRLVERARVVLLAAAGMASRRVARELGCARGGSASGGCGLPGTGSPGSPTRRARASPRPMTPRSTGASWPRSTGRRRRGSLAGPRRCSPGNSAMSAISTSGAFCVPSESTWPDAGPGASAPTRSSLPRPPTSSASTSIRRRTRSCWRSTIARSERGWGPAPTRPGNPAIQALERAQGYLKLPNGRSLHGQEHEYRRRGTTTLFAALEVATGQIKAKHTKRRRRAEFLDFMNEVVADCPGQEIHVVLDNLRTHKPKRDRWRARHTNVHFHFTPTHASWLNQVRSGSRSWPGAPSRAPASPP
jgi:hypothetical protein